MQVVSPQEPPSRCFSSHAAQLFFRHMPPPSPQQLVGKTRHKCPPHAFLSTTRPTKSSLFIRQLFTKSHPRLNGFVRKWRADAPFPALSACSPSAQRSRRGLAVGPRHGHRFPREGSRRGSVEQRRAKRRSGLHGEIGSRRYLALVRRHWVAQHTCEPSRCWDAVQLCSDPLFRWEQRAKPGRRGREGIGVAMVGGGSSISGSIRAGRATGQSRRFGRF